jgi:cellobiose phosphorylase
LKLINPLNHGNSEEKIAIYKVEPYVLAADVYSREPHAGRGGWTWYTGSAGWLYRLITESFLGLQQEDDKLKITPCIPSDWDSFKIHYQFKSAVYHIEVQRISADKKTTLTVNGEEQDNEWITLADDGFEHEVVVGFK